MRIFLLTCAIGICLPLTTAADIARSHRKPTSQLSFISRLITQVKMALYSDASKDRLKQLKRQLETVSRYIDVPTNNNTRRRAKNPYLRSIQNLQQLLARELS